MAVALLLLTAGAVAYAVPLRAAHHAVAAVGHRATIHLAVRARTAQNVSGIGQARASELIVQHPAGARRPCGHGDGLRRNQRRRQIIGTVAAESVASDVLLWKGGELFFCGNFGIMLLDNLASPQVKEILSTMLRVTMMRGAQSAGLVTYDAKGAGTRKRVVNGKRTDLCDLLMAKFGAQVNTGAISAPQLFQGHTRFATSSSANFAGCHPHQ